MELEQALLKIEEATHGDLYDASRGGWRVNAVKTTKTLAAFEAESKNYAAPGQAQRGKLAGFDFIYLGLIQPSIGYPLFPFSVIDLGEVRFAIYENLNFYAD